jgi:hypothetical protein
MKALIELHFQHEAFIVIAFCLFGGGGQMCSYARMIELEFVFLLHQR